MEIYTTLEEQKKQGQNNNQQTTAAQTATNTQQSAQQTAAPAVQTVTQKKTSTYYDAASDLAYQNALQALTDAQKNMPTYENRYEQELSDVYQKITGRDRFTYSVSDDALYQQYKEQYANMGKLAMQDTMGQAAALTGGYGSSYGQSVGQQQYNAYLQKLNEVVPELYGMAYQQYQDEGTALQNQYGMLGDLAADEYSKYQDKLAEYWQNINWLQNEANDAYNRGMQEAELAYSRQQDEHDKLVELMTNIGYMPSEDELEAAGMSTSQMQAYLDYYAKMNPVTESSGGGSGGGGGGYVRTTTTGQNDDPTISNNHGDSWVQVSGMGRMTYQELESAVNDGTVKETVSADGTKVTYTPNRSGNSNNSSSSSGGSTSSSSNKGAVADVTGTANVGTAVSDLLKKLTKAK